MSDDQDIERFALAKAIGFVGLCAIAAGLILSGFVLGVRWLFENL